jgi:hypothetical protein
MENKKFVSGCKNCPKTVLKELMEYFDDELLKDEDVSSIPWLQKASFLLGVKLKIMQELLPKEKEQIENAYNIAWVDLEEDPYCGEISVGEDYYNKTYETNGK